MRGSAPPGTPLEVADGESGTSYRRGRLEELRNMATQSHRIGLNDASISPGVHRQVEDGFVYRLLGWVRQLMCGLHGHDNLMHFEKERVFLQCASCGHESPGWELTEAPPK